MTRAEYILGNAKDPVFKQQLGARKLDVLPLSQWDAQKTRFRKNTVGGEEVIVALDRDAFLHDGDILALDEEKAIVCRIELCEVMVVRFAPEGNPTELMQRCLHLGHALGNQHWPAVVSKGAVYVPLSVARKVMDSVMRTHAFEGISYDFLPGEDIVPLLSPREARRLFGGAEQPGTAETQPHSHGHGHGHEHGHSHEHCCEHDHEHTHAEERAWLQPPAPQKQGCCCTAAEAKHAESSHEHASCCSKGHAHKEHKHHHHHGD